MYIRKKENYWNFKTANTKEYTHCYHIYPAMMIPQVARKLLTDCAPEGELKLVFDPYLGSGTTLVEASIRGISSIGTDLNPLARFISKVKTTHFNIEKTKQAIDSVLPKMATYSPNKVTNTDFDRISNHTFWYSDESLYRLSYLNQIADNLAEEIKDFFLLCLSETVREVSFTRNGEYKRYKMSEKQLSAFHPDVFNIFFRKLQRNLDGLIAFNATSTDCKASIYDFNPSVGIPQSIIQEKSVDMVVTSPPYGDSRTTVAYGQFSRWSNEWFNFENAKTLDKLLMGGTISKTEKFQTESIKEELEMIKNLSLVRYYDVISFLNDYWYSIQNVAKTVRKGGRVCYVVGNRRVKTIQINLDYFTAEMFEKCGFEHNITLVREIASKRMPYKNSPTNQSGCKVETMNYEYLVILTKVQ